MTKTNQYFKIDGHTTERGEKIRNPYLFYSLIKRFFSLHFVLICIRKDSTVFPHIIIDSQTAYNEAKRIDK